MNRLIVSDIGSALVVDIEIVVLYTGKMFTVVPASSDAHRKIGSRGSKCFLHFCKSGLTLAFQVCTQSSEVSQSIHKSMMKS